MKFTVCVREYAKCRYGGYITKNSNNNNVRRKIWRGKGGRVERVCLCFRRSREGYQRWESGSESRVLFRYYFGDGL